LIEMMLALLLSGLLIVMVVRVYGTMSRLEKQLHVLSYLQQKGRFLTFFFSPQHMIPTYEKAIHGKTASMVCSSRLKRTCLHLCYRVIHHHEIRCAQFAIYSSSWRDNQKKKVESFYIKRAGKRRQALVSGMVDFRVMYWVQRKHVWQGVSAKQVSLWSNVKMLELQWLLRSSGWCSHPNHQYWYAGKMHVNRSHHWIIPWTVYVKV